MNIARVMICCTLLLSASWFAQPASAQDELPGVAQVSHFGGWGSSNPWGTRSGVSSVWGDGRGWDDGSTTFFIRQPFSVMPEQFVVLPEARGNILHTGDFSGNLGVTGRYFDYSSGYVFGLSGWYDHDISSMRDFQNAFTYHQLGISAEALGPVWDFRANAYFPLDEDPNLLQESEAGLDFTAFSLVCRFQQLTETALRGGDFEIGGNVIDGLANWGIRPYVGAYYYEGEEADQAIGVKARLEALVTQDFALEGQVTNDRLFGTHVTMGATWTFGSGQSPRWFTRQRQVDRLYAQVERNYRLALFRQISFVEQQALDPVTGDPILAFHIDNTAAPGGNGSAEAPLNFLPASVPPSSTSSSSTAATARTTTRPAASTCSTSSGCWAKASRWRSTPTAASCRCRARAGRSRRSATSAARPSRWPTATRSPASTSPTRSTPASPGRASSTSTCTT